MTDARRYSCTPIDATGDPRLTDGTYRVLGALGQFANLETGKVTAALDTLLRAAGRAADADRGFRKSVRQLEECGYVQVTKEGHRNIYWLLWDKRHRNSGSGNSDSDTGTVVPMKRNGGSGQTGTAVPGERVNNENSGTTTAEGAREATRNGGSGVASDDSEKQHRNGGSGIETDEEDAMDPDLREMAKQLAIGVNGALRDNPNTRRQAEIHALSGGLAATPLRDWLSAGIPFDLILKTCVEVAGRYSPAQAGDRISRFTYFDRPVREAHDRAQAKQDLDAIPVTRPASASVPKIRRFA